MIGASCSLVLCICSFSKIILCQLKPNSPGKETWLRTRYILEKSQKRNWNFKFCCYVTIHTKTFWIKLMYTVQTSPSNTLVEQTNLLTHNRAFSHSTCFVQLVNLKLTGMKHFVPSTIVIVENPFETLLKSFSTPLILK